MNDTKEGNCAICNERYTRWGNNPEPILSVNDRVCDQCNSMFVIPTRMGTEFTAERAKMIAEALKPYNVLLLTQLWGTMLFRPTPKQMEALRLLQEDK